MDISEAKIESLVIHKIGCKAAPDNDPSKENFYSKHEIQFIDEDTQTTLKTFLELALKAPEAYKFREQSNSVAVEIARIFEQKANFYDASIRMAEKFYNILEEKSELISNFFVLYLTNCKYDDQADPVDAVAIFMSDKRERYLKLMQNENEINFQEERGISLKKMDRGCIIFNVESDSGYIIKSETSAKGANEFWIENYLDAKVIETEYFNTQAFFKICKEFNENILSKEDELTKNGITKNDGVKSQVDFLQNSLNYFNNNQTFSEQQFAEATLGNENAVKAFNNFAQHYRNEHNIETPQNFNIDGDAVKKSKRYLRSVIKLDKNFHIYVHTNTENITREYDEQKQKRFYKLLFDVDS